MHCNIFARKKSRSCCSGDPDNRFFVSDENAVSLKLPTFWTSQPEVCFAQAKAQVNLLGISASDTKYFYVLAALDQEAETCLLDFISHPPTDDKYEEFKDRLIATFGLSRRERVSHLLQFLLLGDSKPSALMDEMLGLLSDHPPCLVFDQPFFKRLPENIRIQLVDFKFDDLCQPAKWADALWSCQDMASDIDAVRHEPLARQRSTTQTSTPSQGTLCYYHRRFGQAARQCRQPCTWSENEQAGRRSWP